MSETVKVPCRMCEGRGFKPTIHGSRECDKCDGTGSSEYTQEEVSAAIDKVTGDKDE